VQTTAAGGEKMSSSSSASRKQSVALVLLGLALGLLLAWANDKARISGSIQLETQRAVKRQVWNANGTTNLRSHVVDDNSSPLNRNSSAVEVGEIEDPPEIADPPRSCRRTCPNYDNRIIVAFKQKAGLKETAYIMRSWANMGMFLCAKVHIPSPAEWLASKHSPNLQLVDTNITWERDFMYFTDKDDDSVVALSDLVETTEPKNGWGMEVTSMSSRKAGKDMLVKDLLKVYNYTVLQQNGSKSKPFVWSIKGKYHEGNLLKSLYNLRNRSPPLLAMQLPKWDRHEDDLCVYASRVLSQSIRHTAQQVLQKLTQRFGVKNDEPLVYGYLHVRTGDLNITTGDVCPNKLSNLTSYVDCTFASFCEDAESDHCSADVPLLLASDETDPKMRHDMIDLIDNQKGLKGVDLDGEITEQINKEIATGESTGDKTNNYSVFLVGAVISQEATFYLRRHRLWCNSCDADKVVLDSDQDRRWWSSRLPIDFDEADIGKNCPLYDSKVVTLPLEGSSPDLTQALECLRKTKPNLVLSEYPSDSFEHYTFIHQRLSTWTQQPNHVPHRAAHYAGPWMENHFISRFQPLIKSKADLIHHFGPYIPIFVPWTDHWVNGKYTYPSALVDDMKCLLREDTLYIVLSQNADGFVGRCSEFQALQDTYHITILSAGGWGHVPIPLLKQPEERRNTIPIAKREHFVSYVGSATNAPNNLRKDMISQSHVYYYHGPDWRSVMANSKFSLVPRGFGRTSYHLMEALQMGLIPIQVYLDQPWIPYEHVLQNVTFAVTMSELPGLIRELSRKSDAQIEEMEDQIERLGERLFTFEGALNEIQMFMTDPSLSALRCGKLPTTSRFFGPDDNPIGRNHKCGT